MHLDTQIGTSVHKIDIYMSKRRFGATGLGIKFPVFENWNSVSLHIVICWLQSFSKHKQSSRGLKEWTRAKLRIITPNDAILVCGLD